MTRHFKCRISRKQRLIMAALWNRADHYVFALCFLLSSSFFLAFSQPLLIGCLPYFHTPNFARCLAVSWAGTLYIHFGGFLPPKGILPAAKFTLRPSRVLSYIGNVTARHLSSGHQPNFAGWSKYSAGRLITLGIGPHSSLLRKTCTVCNNKRSSQPSTPHGTVSWVPAFLLSIAINGECGCGR